MNDLLFLKTNVFLEKFYESFVLYVSNRISKLCHFSECFKIRKHIGTKSIKTALMRIALIIIKC